MNAERNEARQTMLLLLAIKGWFAGCCSQHECYWRSFEYRADGLCAVHSTGWRWPHPCSTFNRSAIRRRTGNLHE